MKKFLLVLGMITCLAGLTACGSAEETNAPTTITQEQAELTVENFIVSIQDVIATGAQDQYKSDAVILAAINSYETALADLGDYQSMDSCTFTEDEDGIIINAVISGSERKATVEMIFDEEYNLTSASTNVIYSFGEQMTKAGLNTLMGMGTVFSVLILIALVIYCFNFIPKIQAAFSKKDTKAEASVGNAVSQIAQNEAVQEEEEDDLELIAVIAAAIAASEGAASTDGYVVRSLRRIR